MHTRKRSDYLIVVLPLALTLCVILGLFPRKPKQASDIAPARPCSFSVKFQRLTLLFKGRRKGAAKVATIVVNSSPLTFALSGGAGNVDVPKPISFIVPIGNWTSVTWRVVGSVNGFPGPVGNELC